MKNVHFRWSRKRFFRRFLKVRAGLDLKIRLSVKMVLQNGQAIMPITLLGLENETVMPNREKSDKSWHESGIVTSGSYLENLVCSGENCPYPLSMSRKPKMIIPMENPLVPHIGAKPQYALPVVPHGYGHFWLARLAPWARVVLP